MFYLIIEMKKKHLHQSLFMEYSDDSAYASR